jgi:hypothetical protein
MVLLYRRSHHPTAGEAIMLELTVLTMPDCPNGPIIMERLAEALADLPDARLVRHVVHDEAGATRHGMHGSPTLLVNGVDPFAAPGTTASVSCRIYRDETGHIGGAPSVVALRRTIEQATRFAEVPVLPDSVGQTLSRKDALKTGVQIFGPLLRADL